MKSPLLTYLHDHLGGATFACSLLSDLSQQNLDDLLATRCAGLLDEIKTDASALEKIITQLGGDAHSPKSAAAWVAEKAQVALKRNIDDGRKI